MKKPTPRETLPRLVALGIITSDDSVRYLANYEYFEQQRDPIEQDFSGMWVASIGNEIIVGCSLYEIRQLLDRKPDGRFAYVEEIV